MPESDLVLDLRAQLAAAAARETALRQALTEISQLNHVRNDEDRPPIPVALERWHQCIQLAKQALAAPAETRRSETQENVARVDRSAPSEGQDLPRSPQPDGSQ